MALTDAFGASCYLHCQLNVIGNCGGEGAQLTVPWPFCRLSMVMVDPSGSKVEKFRAPIVNFVRVGAGCGLIRPDDYVSGVCVEVGAVVGSRV